MDDRDSILNPDFIDPRDKPFLDQPEPRGVCAPASERRDHKKEYADALALNANRYNNPILTPMPEPVPSTSPPPPPVRKKRGGQPGNLNALKHGLYLDGHRIQSTTPVEMSELCDFAGLIKQIKEYMAYAYDIGSYSYDIRVINETLRALSLAAMSLTRLVDMYREYSTVDLPDDLDLTNRTTIATLINQYNKKLEPYLRLVQQDSPQEES